MHCFKILACGSNLLTTSEGFFLPAFIFTIEEKNAVLPIHKLFLLKLNFMLKYVSENIWDVGEAVTVSAPPHHSLI